MKDNYEPPMKPILLYVGVIVGVYVVFSVLVSPQSAWIAAAIATIIIPTTAGRFFHKKHGVKTWESEWKKPDSWNDEEHKP